jgi:hypothetical protein
MVNKLKNRGFMKINTRKYIALGLIGLSASGIQGMNWMQRMRASCLPQITQFAQKIRPYRYHIGGALALAGLVCGYQVSWNYLFPYEILAKYETPDCSNNSVRIYAITCNSKKLIDGNIRKISWDRGYGNKAIKDFIENYRQKFNISRYNPVDISYKNYTYTDRYSNNGKSMAISFLANAFAANDDIELQKISLKQNRPN